MWAARNKDGRLRIFEVPPKRFHEGPELSKEASGFNDALSTGDDPYSFWAVQEFCDSDRIDDRKHYGYRIMTEKTEDGKTIFFDYEPETLKKLSWEDSPVEIEITIKKPL